MASESPGLDRKDYVVYMGATPKDDGNSQKAPATLYLAMLESVYGSSKAAKDALKYSYGKSFGGFAATLSPSHVQQLSGMDGVVSVFESKKLQTLTTRSWDFVGLPASVQSNSLAYQSDIIIGLLDTGIWPESESFTDEGFGPVPSKWRGGCQTTPDFSACNKKLIGAKFYRSFTSIPPQGDFLSPRDGEGHGTHTSSTSTGNFINNANLYGIAQGESRGGVPGARVAMYKVCWADGCYDADILAAFDDAIYDGVDILSASLGYPFPLDYFQDSIAIGAFHAIQKGILVSNSAGNSGPSRATVANYSPWSLTVAASTIDRKMNAELQLGNNISVEGIAVNTYTMEKPWYPLVYGGDVANVSGGFTPDNSSACLLGSLDQTKVKGKIVICNFISTLPDYSVFVAGGAGVVIINDGLYDTAFAWLNPATLISTKQAKIVLSYINSTSSPIANIQKTTTPKAPAPIVASFSSRGFNPITMDILKPDITAPGVDILASWAKNVSLTGYTDDPRFSNFNIISGTSMSCPHAAGAAGFVKSYHSDWSPAAIKSALLTTAFVMDETLPGNADVEFGYGAGQINPTNAVNPGLVYDAGVDDYINMLCNEGYSDTTLRLVTGDFSGCDQIIPSKNGARELNYPSIMVFTAPEKSFQAKFPRTVTNVGVAESAYKAIVSAPSGINVTVEPDTLKFSSLNQKLSYNVTIEGGSLLVHTLLSGALTWSYGNYTVRSPISVYAAFSL
ncbi:subtilisin-like protease SBT4.14 [Cryptomeria japonica]|uniref:subtilisin-like protease SBT4.14 n=1 Tax=Cryptomeria japonica TaxID=3369 RepID=UPI0025AC1A5D|nr:subtilisin-like protease SBT4.14 [Cryptomeria japonica]